MNRTIDSLYQSFPDMLPHYCIECDDGWADILYNMLAKLKELDIGFSALQIKEKFATLRVYYRYDDSKEYPDDIGEKLKNIINEAEKASGETCEICGKPGCLRERFGWITTLCDDHFKEIK